MRPNQRKLNEFLVDLIEFVQKHFQPPVTRTKVLEENGCAGVLMRHEPSGSEVEVTTLHGKVEIRRGDGKWAVPGEDAAELYANLIGELLAVFAGRKGGPWGGAPGPQGKT
jgi:hypothetical protein